jgi:hypothetical protein
VGAVFVYLDGVSCPTQEFTHVLALLR